MDIDRKIKIAMLILIVLTEKQKRINKIGGKDAISDTILNAVECLYWIKQIHFLKQSNC